MLKLFAIMIGGLIMIRICIAAIRRMWRPLALLQKLVCGVGLGLLLLLSLALVASGYESGAWGAVAGGLVGGLFVLKFTGQLLVTPAGVHSPTKKESMPLPRQQPISDAWPAFTAKLPWTQRHRANRVKASLDSFLAEQHSRSLSIEHQSLLVTIDRRVPELLAECLARCVRATPREQRGYVERGLVSLEKIAAQAERARQEIREADDRELEVLHHYFEEVSSKPA